MIRRPPRSTPTPSSAASDVYKRQELFKRIRKWQSEYAYEQPPDKMGNLLRQCPIRDNYKVIYEIIKETKAKPIDEFAAKALEDENYRKGLIAYGEEIGKRTEKFWQRFYLGKK